MTPTQADARIQQLRAEVAHHDRRYHGQSAQEISDFEYDRLKRELADLEAKFPQFRSEASPSTQVGSTCAA